VWPRLSCRRFQNNVVRLQLHALAYDLGNFMRTLALPEAVDQWSLTSLREKLVKIGARIVAASIRMRTPLGGNAAAGMWHPFVMRTGKTTGAVCPDDDEIRISGAKYAGVTVLGVSRSHDDGQGCRCLPVEAISARR
jgi:hypothetical protein